jgi:hypothetical protein
MRDAAVKWVFHDAPATGPALVSRAALADLHALALASTYTNSASSLRKCGAETSLAIYHTRFYGTPEQG